MAHGSFLKRCLKNLDRKTERRQYCGAPDHEIDGGEDKCRESGPLGGARGLKAGIVDILSPSPCPFRDRDHRARKPDSQENGHRCKINHLAVDREHSRARSDDHQHRCDPWWQQPRHMKHDHMPVPEKPNQRTLRPRVNGPTCGPAPWRDDEAGCPAHHVQSGSCQARDESKPLVRRARGDDDNVERDRREACNRPAASTASNRLGNGRASVMQTPCDLGHRLTAFGAVIRFTNTDHIPARQALQGWLGGRAGLVHRGRVRGTTACVRSLATF